MAFDKEKTLAAAQKFQDRGQYEKAIREYNKVLEAEPNDDRTMLSVARCYEGAGKQKEAGQMYGKVIQIYRDTGAYQKAIAISKQALKCVPDDEEITIGMAELNNAIGLTHEAVSLLEKCLNRHNRETDGEGYLRILMQMVRVDSENVQTRLRYAETLNYLGDVESAKRQYSLVLALFLGKERYVDYIQTAREYLKLEPHDEEVLCELGNIYIKMERYTDSLKIMSELDPSKRSAEMRELFVTCYKRLGRKNDAINELKALARQLKAEGGREERIENVWHQVQQLSPNDPDAAAAFGDVPLLSDSALNAVVSPAVENEQRNGVAPEVSQAERELAQKFMQALQAYRLGNVEEAKYLCQQILCVNLNYVSALQLLSQIFENEQEHPLQAQVERQLAKVAFATDVNEAVRHVLKAERCMPSAVENYNLLLSFGVDPTQYGLGNVNVAAAMPPGPPNLPGRPNTPPMPPARNLPNGARPPMPPQASQYQSIQPSHSITSNSLEFDIDDEELSAVDEELDGAFDLMFGGPKTPSAASQMNMYKLQVEDVPPQDDYDSYGSYDKYEDYDDDDDSSRTIAHDISSLAAAVSQAYQSPSAPAEEPSNAFMAQSQIQSQFSQQPSPQYNQPEPAPAPSYAEQPQATVPYMSPAQNQAAQPTPPSFNANAQTAAYVQPELPQPTIPYMPPAQNQAAQPAPPSINASAQTAAFAQPEQPQNPSAPHPPVPGQFPKQISATFNANGQPAAYSQSEQAQPSVAPHPPVPGQFPKQTSATFNANGQPAAYSQSEHVAQPTPALHPPVLHPPVPGHFPKQTPAPFGVQPAHYPQPEQGNAQSSVHPPLPTPIQNGENRQNVNVQAPPLISNSGLNKAARIAPSVSGGRIPGLGKYPGSGFAPAAPSASSAGISAASRSAVPGLNAPRPLGVVPPRIPNAPSPVAVNMPSPVAPPPVAPAGLSNSNLGTGNRDVAAALSGIPGISMPSSGDTIPYVEPVASAGIPDSERQKVMESLQEVEFYASLMLEADARTVLQGLIDKYGDIDIIHEAKVKLDGGA